MSASGQQPNQGLSAIFHIMSFGAIDYFQWQSLSLKESTSPHPPPAWNHYLKCVCVVKVYHGIHREDLFGFFKWVVFDYKGAYDLHYEVQARRLLFSSVLFISYYYYSLLGQSPKLLPHVEFCLYGK